MSDIVDQITAVLRADGWTCEYHEPVSGPGECGACDVLHQDTAERIVAELGMTAVRCADERWWSTRVERGCY